MKEKIDVKYVAKLARINLSAEELSKFSAQLDDILSYVEKLNSKDTSNVMPTSHVLSLKNVYRQDAMTSSLAPEKALSNAPDRQGSFFDVPKIIEEK